MPVQTTVQMRRDTAANWTSTNPTLASGEWGLETDTRLMKIGDGTTAWNSLAYQLGPMLDEVIATDPNGAYFTGSGFQTFGVLGNLVSTPDSAALSITGDIDIRLKLKLPDWTPSVAMNLFGKWLATGNQRSYGAYIATNGTLVFSWSTNGINGFNATSTAAVGATDDTTKWIRITLDVDNGAAGRTITFYTSDDGTNWTQLGNTVTQATTTSIFDSTAPFEIGLNDNAFPTNGTFYRAQILNGIGGTTVFDANFESVAADSFAFTESSANAATVTLTTTRYSFGIPGQTLIATVALSLTANATHYWPFTVRGKPITLKHFAFEVTTGPATNSTMRLGIYKADSQMQPTGSIIIESGAITIPSGAGGVAIYRTRLTPTVLQPGNYLYAFNTSVTHAVRAYNGGVTYIQNRLGASSIGESYRVTETLSGAALPTTGTKWNTFGASANPLRNFMLLGWS